MPIHSLSNEEYEKAGFAISDESLEIQCKNRGIRMAFLTLAPILGFGNLSLIKELHSCMTCPMNDSFNQKREIDDELFLRMSYWATQAHDDIHLFNEAEQAIIERCANSVFKESRPLSQERFQKLKDVLFNSDHSLNPKLDTQLN